MLLTVGVISLVVGLAVGAGILYVMRQMADNKTKTAAEREVDRILNRAKSQAGKIERDSKNKAKDFENRARRNAENDIRKQKQKLTNTEQQLASKESRLDKDYRRKEDDLNGKIRGLDERDEKMRIVENRIREMEESSKRQIEGLQEKLQSVASMSTDEARKELKSALEDEARQEVSARLSEIEEHAQKEALTKARRILSTAISRYASEVATEKTVSIVALTSDEMKGKIIGREGRNIRALEAACGVDLIIDETPEAVVISSFDAVRRETARQTLEKLMEDGRVHPARIEEAVSKVKQDLFKTMKEDGEKACIDLAVIEVHDSVLNLLGSLRYRNSQSYNLYKHCVEVGYIAGLIAAEIGADVIVARRAGLLHSIGRAVDHNTPGSYAQVGAEFLKKHGERKNIVSAVRCHTGEVEAVSVLDHVVQAAFRLAEARPGVRRQMMESYIRRLGDLESVANSFDGVQRTFAIQSGKEIRVLVDSGKITDDQSKMLSRDIAKKIERELNYPGQVKVTVVRETRIVEHAR